MFRLNKIKKLIILALLYISNLTLTLNFSTLTIGVNDDEFFEQLVSGSFTGNPESFTHIAPASPQWFFGFLISRLYLINNNVSWYYLFLSFAVLTSLLCINYLVWINNLIQPIYKFSIFLINFYALFWFVSSPTYTSASFFVAFAGIYIYINKLVNRSNGIKLELISSFFLILSVSIRTESFFAAVILLFPILIYFLVIYQDNYKKKIRSISALTLPVFLIVLINYSADNYYFSKPEWKIYQDFNNARYKIQDNELERFISDNLDKTNWSKVKFKLFDSYNFVDFNSYNGSELNKLIDSINVDKSTEKVNFGDLIKRWKTYALYFYMILWATVLLLAYSILSQLFQNHKFRNQLSELFWKGFFLVTWIAFILYISIFLRLPERVVFPIISSLIYGFILFEFRNSIYNKKTRKNVYIKIFQYFSIILIFFGIGNDYYKMFSLRKNPAYVSFWSEQKSSLLQINRGKVLIGNASQIKSIWSNPYIVNQEIRQLNFLPLGWYTFSPYWIKRAEMLGLNNKSVITEFNMNPNLYWLSDDEYTQYLIDLNFDLYGIKLIPRKVLNKTFDFGDYSVYEFTYKI